MIKNHVILLYLYCNTVKAFYGIIKKKKHNKIAIIFLF